MLNILADALLLATGQRPLPRRHTRPEAEANDRFTSARMQGLDYQGHRFNTKRDLNW